ncbi:hypothetical protein CDL15_Pgr020071 [Punica granatum]|uniref:GPI transamidase component PIG-T n=1 Tax=Punica granatum TaxID=22663 RepID=A0A218VQG9_PUNGR|nr:hypothetical protein CDL15_Pgr020071 [Punica granatum]PKI76767.1 hypothetical protein CRG98_002753 [Punica granatum]
MELLRRPIFSLLLLLSLPISFPSISLGSAVQGEDGHREEEFTEELLLKPLPDRKVLAHFHFENTAQRTQSYGRHHHLFPKAISQLVKKFAVREMELSFTQGRWNYESWGGFDPISSSNAKPPGVELWATFDVPPDQVDASWKNLTHSLSGLFCASINFLESSATYSAPEWAFQPASGNLRYGTLPREAVCTENLTPWLKLLPCRDKAGISSLMDRPSIYRGFYHSQRLRLRPAKIIADGADSGIVLEQTLTVVLQPNGFRTKSSHSSENKIPPTWAMSSLLGRKIEGRCVLAKSSNVYLQLERGLVAELNALKENQEFVGTTVLNDDLIENPAFEISVKPDWVLKEVGNLPTGSSSLMYGYSIGKSTDSGPFDLHLTWKSPMVWSCPRPPLHASRFLMGSGNERGAIAISLRSTGLNEGLYGSNKDKESCVLPVNVFQVVPWYIKVYFHTIKVFIDEQRKAVPDVIEKIRVSPSEDKVLPGVMEMVLKLPCGVKSAAMTLEFDKGFLHIDEYPPDANQGFDIPSAIITFPNVEAAMHFNQFSSSDKSPLLSRFREKNPVQSYTEVLLVPLTTPDFSMPYNVITITCTVFALYFGSLLNVLRKRASEEERLLRAKGRSSPLSRLLAKLRRKKEVEPQSSTTSSSLFSSKLVVKIILVAAIAICWQYFG